MHFWWFCKEIFLQVTSCNFHFWMECTTCFWLISYALLNLLKSYTKILHIWETLNLLTCADKSTNTKTDRKKDLKKIMCHVAPVKCQVSGVRYYVSCVTYHVSFVNVPFHLSHVSNANSHSHRPSPIMKSRLVCKILQKKSYYKLPPAIFIFEWSVQHVID